MITGQIADLAEDTYALAARVGELQAETGPVSPDGTLALSACGDGFLALDGSETAAGVEFADPGLLPDGKKRYPANTAERVVRAWQLVNQEGNTLKYTRQQLEQVKSAIARTAKKFGVELHDESGNKVEASTITGDEAKDVILHLSVRHPGFLRA